MQYKLKIVQDEYCESPREWGNIGTMAYKHSRYNLGDVEMSSPAEYLCDLAFPNESSDEKLGNLCDFHGWGSMDGSDSVEYLLNYLEEKKGYIILPLYLYDHSGITMSTSAFGCRWDSGQVGWIHANLDSVKEHFPSWKKWTKDRKETIRKYLTGEVETFDKYISGDVYGYILEDKDGEEIDSCWGFFGYDIETNGMKDHVNVESWDMVEVVEPW